MNARRLIPLLGIVFALVAAPAASAKQIESVQACGSDGCVTTRDRAIIAGLMDGGTPTVPPRAPDGAIRLTATVVEEPGGDPVGTFESWWVPSLKLLVGADGTWMPLPTRAVNALNGLGLEPLPASEMGSAAATAPKAPAPPTDDGSAPTWLLIFAALALAGTLVAAAMFAQRPRRPRPGPSVTT
jgi:hypothetical protein